MLLKKAAAKDFTPYAIASIMCRESRQKSPLEKIHSLAMSRSTSRGAVDEGAYLARMSDSLDDYLDQLLLDEIL